MASTVLTTSETKNQESQWQSTRLAGHGSGGEFQANADKAERLKPELKRANEVVRQLALPWDGLFKAIEVFDPNQVALLRIETDVSRHAVTIAAESESFEAMLGYIKNLGKQSALTEVYLIDHQIQEHDVQRPVRFTVSAVWLGNKW
jgi:Tfp pilus assembly protein PilN